MKRVTITATKAMSDTTYRFICEQIEKKYGQKFEFCRVDDQEIIGGFIINIDTKFYDLSYKNRLSEIGKHILN